MTPPAHPDDLRPGRDTPLPPLHLRGDGELVATIPAVLGFHPRRSLVLLATGGDSGHRLGLVLRVDLPPPENAESVAQLAVRGLLQDSPASAVVVVVTDEHHGAGPPQRALVRLVVAALREHGVPAHTVLWAEGTVEGARWVAYAPDGREHASGRLPDPSTTPYAVAAVTSGRILRSEREALERLVEPADPERVRRREELLLGAVDRAVRGGVRADPEHDEPLIEDVLLDDGRAAGLALLHDALADAESGRLALHEERHDGRVVALAAALTHHPVRDTALRWCIGPSAGAAEQLWTALVRESPDPEAAEPAALLAVSALLRGDGALANVALDRAERAWPGHRLSALLRVAAQAGMRPERLRASLIEYERGSTAPPSDAGPSDAGPSDARPPGAGSSAGASAAPSAAPSATQAPRGRGRSRRRPV
jgi:hypothetical protein